VSGLAAPVLQERRAAEVSETARDKRAHFARVDARRLLQPLWLRGLGLRHLRLLPAAAYVRHLGNTRHRDAQAQRDGCGEVGVL
jgi:hypothetical protein